MIQRSTYMHDLFFFFFFFFFFSFFIFSFCHVIPKSQVELSSYILVPVLLQHTVSSGTVHKYPTRCILYIPVVAYRLHSALLHSRCKGLSRATVPQTECSSTIPEFRVAGAYSSFFSGWRGSQGGSLVKVIQIHQK